jgi:hypothetical protein
MFQTCSDSCSYSLLITKRITMAEPGMYMYSCCSRLCECVCVCVCVCARVCVRVYVIWRAHASVCVRMCMCKCMCVRTCVCTCMVSSARVYLFRILSRSTMCSGDNLWWELWPWSENIRFSITDTLYPE